MDRKMIIAIVMALLIVSAGAFIILSDEGNNTEGPVTLVDAIGRNVTTAVAPSRIVSLSPSLTEIVYALDIGDRLVAVTDYCNWPQEVNDRRDNGSLASIGGYWNPSIEAIVEAEPDIILLDQGVQAQLSLLPQLEALQLNVMVLHMGLNFDEVFKNIEMIGQICWEEDRATALIDSMNDRLDEIADTLAGVDENPTVAFCVWLDPIYLSGNGTFVNEMISLAHGVNAYQDLTSWPMVSIESILERDPEFLIVTGMMLENSGEAVLQKLRNDTFWSATSAVQNNHVFVFVNQAENIFNRPGPRMIDGVEMMAKILHSGVFNVTVPNVLSDDYVEWVTGIGAYRNVAVPVTDSLGRSVPAMSEATTIVTCSPSLTELVYSLGLGNRLVGVSSNCDFPAEVKDRVSNGSLATIGKYNKPNAEAIANLGPGLVVLDGGVSGHMSILTQLEGMNLTCVVLYESKTVGLIYNNIEMMGNLFGVQSVARGNIDAMAKTMSKVREVTDGRSSDVKVMFSIYFSSSSIWVVGNNTFINNVIGLAGGENVFLGQNGYGTVSAEAVLTANPDVIVITDNMASVNYTQLMDWLTNDPVWKEVNAVKNGQVYLMTKQAGDIFTRPSVRVAHGVNLLGALLYPELFGIDPLPSIIGNEYLTYI